MKRIVSLLLIAACLLSLAACSSAGEPVYEKPDSYTDDGRLIIEVFGHELDTLLKPSDDTAKILAMVEIKFGIKLNITTVPVANSSTKLAQLIGGGDVPDMFIHFKEEPAYAGWLEANFLMDYEPYLSDYPYLQKAFQALGSEKEVKSLLRGGYYSYPIIMHNDIVRAESEDETAAYSGSFTTELGMFYRRDWYQALQSKGWTPSSGRPLLDPEDPSFNYENFYDLMEGFTRGDPDGNGKNDTYGYSLCKDSGVHWWFPILNMFNAFTDGWYLDESGTWQPENTSENMKQGVMFLAKMLDNGFINSDYSTTATFDAAKNNFVNGKAGCVVSNVTWNMGSGVVDMMTGYLGKVAGSKVMTDVVRGMPVVTGIDGTKRVLGAINNYAYMAINNDISETKKKAILDLLNYILSPEGDTLLTWGIEGEHYRVEADGSYKNLLEKDSKGNQRTLIDNEVAWGIYRLKGFASWETPFTNDPRPHPEATDQLMTAWDPQYMYIDELHFVTVSESFASIQAELSDETAKYFKMIVKTGVSESEREALWQEYVDRYTKKGSNYIAEMDRAAKELYPSGK